MTSGKMLPSIVMMMAMFPKLAMSDEVTLEIHLWQEDTTDGSWNRLSNVRVYARAGGSPRSDWTRRDRGAELTVPTGTMVTLQCSLPSRELRLLATLYTEDRQTLHLAIDDKAAPLAAYMRRAGRVMAPDALVDPMFELHKIEDLLLDFAEAAEREPLPAETRSAIQGLREDIEAMTEQLDEMPEEGLPGLFMWNLALDEDEILRRRTPVQWRNELLEILERATATPNAH